MKEKLVIIFPGIGYHCDKPLLYYAKKLAKEHGYEEIVSLKYSYTGKISVEMRKDAGSM